MPRKPSATVQLKARMKEPLRARLEEDAKSRGISLNAALVDRLELLHEEVQVALWTTNREVIAMDGARQAPLREEEDTEK